MNTVRYSSCEYAPPPSAPCRGRGNPARCRRLFVVFGTGPFSCPDTKGMRTTNDKIIHIRTGPPEEGESPIPDSALAYLILGCFRAAAEFQNFPVLIDHIEENMDDEGMVQSFTIVTASLLRFTVHVDYEEES